MKVSHMNLIHRKEYTDIIWVYRRKIVERAYAYSKKSNIVFFHITSYMPHDEDRYCKEGRHQVDYKFLTIGVLKRDRDMVYQGFETFDAFFDKVVKFGGPKDIDLVLLNLDLFQKLIEHANDDGSAWMAIHYRNLWRSLFDYDVIVP